MVESENSRSSKALECESDRDRRAEPLIVGQMENAVLTHKDAELESALFVTEL